jgi:arginine-tRNA-protein transferase
VAVRIPVARFRPNRNQRRALKRNADLQARWITVNALNDEQWGLYHAYLQARHGDGEMARASRADSDAFLFSAWADTRLLELRRGDRLLAVAVTDAQPHSLSALYTFFHPAHAHRSLGTLAVLLQVEAARQAGRRWLYLGYWIPDCRKMSYKARFLPLEVRLGQRRMKEEQWRMLETAGQVHNMEQKVKEPFSRDREPA